MNNNCKKLPRKRIQLFWEFPHDLVKYCVNFFGPLKINLRVGGKKSILTYATCDEGLQEYMASYYKLKILGTTGLTQLRNCFLKRKEVMVLK